MIRSAALQEGSCAQRHGMQACQQHAAPCTSELRLSPCCAAYLSITPTLLGTLTQWIADGPSVESAGARTYQAQPNTDPQQTELDLIPQNAALEAPAAAVVAAASGG